MANNEDKFRKIIAHAKEYGFVFQSSEIYDGLSAVYDYGQYGVELKNNIKDYWWKSMVQYHENIVGVDAAIFMHPAVWKASGHVDAFSDPMIDNKDSKKRYRADVLVEDHIVKLEGKIQKEVTKAAKRFGDSFDEEQFSNTNPRVLSNKKKIEDIKQRLYSAMKDKRLGDVKTLIEDLGIVCPISGSRNWTDVRQFDLMFSTRIGSLSDEANEIYLRPETAQGIFVNYLNIQKTGRMKIPFGIAQMGKAFRNEIVARQFIFRMREFEQMEMQFFVRPGDEIKWFDYWKEERMKWHLGMGIPQEKYKFHEHENLAHYANAAFDIEFEFPIGFKELEGIHSRTDFDLKSHQEYSGKKIQYFDPEINDSYIPYVVETSIGLDRTFLAVLSNAYTEEKLEDGSERIVMKIPPFLAPIKAAVLPLVKKDGLPEKAMEIFDKLKYNYMCFYEEKDSIGKRYRRQDAIGTPYCFTIDHQTFEDNTVTIRERDSMKQDRIGIDRISEIISERLKSNK
ncbi:MAG: glycine--tRNA ligase [Bacteroidetes bacterium]|nr:glycine--tRNA ligase [Bacteroidota bacterium]MBL7103489.1 glycine--tRNA ligase [Bacteroidales bacterium]